MRHFQLAAEGNFVSFCPPLVKEDIVWGHTNLWLTEKTIDLFFYKVDNYRGG